MRSVGRVAVVDGAAVDVTVTVAVSLLLGEMEPDVRLLIMLPACTWNGAVLPCVLSLHALVDELPGPQQKNLSPWNGEIQTPPLVWTKRRKCERC